MAGRTSTKTNSSTSATCKKKRRFRDADEFDKVFVSDVASAEEVLGGSLTEFDEQDQDTPFRLPDPTPTPNRTPPLFGGLGGDRDDDRRRSDRDGFADRTDRSILNPFTGE